MLSSRYPRSLPAFLCLLVLAPLGACVKRASPIVAEVGRFSITARDAELKNRVSAVYYPSDGRDLGLHQLVREYTLAQILENNGHLITAETIAREEERIDRQTQAPALLAQIKRIFEGDTDAYRRVYVLPIHASRVIYYGFFMNNPAIHAEKLREAKRDFEAFRKAHRNLASKKELSRFFVTPDGELTWQLPGTSLSDKERVSSPGGGLVDGSGPPEAVRRRVEGRMNARAPKALLEIMPSLAPGAWHPELIEWGDRWYGVRRASSPGKALPEGAVAFEAISYPKRDYKEWLEAEKKRVPVRYHP